MRAEVPQKKSPSRGARRGAGGEGVDNGSVAATTHTDQLGLAQPGPGGPSMCGAIAQPLARQRVTALHGQRDRDHRNVVFGDAVNDPFNVPAEI